MAATFSAPVRTRNRRRALRNSVGAWAHSFHGWTGELLALDDNVRGDPAHTFTRRHAWRLQGQGFAVVDGSVHHRGGFALDHATTKSNAVITGGLADVSTFRVAGDLSAARSGFIRESRSPARALATAADYFIRCSYFEHQAPQRYRAGSALHCDRDSEWSFHVTTALGINLCDLAVLYDSACWH